MIRWLDDGDGDAGGDGDGGDGDAGGDGDGDAGGDVVVMVIVILVVEEHDRQTLASWWFWSHFAMQSKLARPKSTMRWLEDARVQIV